MARLAKLQRQLAAIKATRGMLRAQDGTPANWAAMKDEERRLEKRRDAFLAGIGGDRPLRTDLTVEMKIR